MGFIIARMENFSNIKLIAFDVDGTLAETDEYYIDKAAGAIRKVLPFLPEEGTRKFVRPFIMIGETILHGCYRLLDLVGLDDIISRIHSRVSGKDAYRYKAVDGMQDVLADLSRKYTLGIISSGGRESTAAFVRAFKLENCVTEGHLRAGLPLHQAAPDAVEKARREPTHRHRGHDARRRHDL